MKAGTDARTGPHLLRERARWNDGLRWVAGTDEAGRGCLCGPVVAGCAILRPDADPAAFEGLDDSKRLTHARIRDIAERIRQGGYREAGLVAWGIGAASVAEIDRLNIRRATVLAMNRAIRSAEQRLAREEPGASVQFALVDGSPAPELEWPNEAFPKADQISISVSLAAVLAKDRRDRHMERLARHYPTFACIAGDKGYGSPAHMEAIRVHGPVRGLHRASFTPVVQTSLF